MSSEKMNMKEMLGNVSTREEVTERFKAGMRQFPSGLTLLTSEHNGVKGGLIASAFSSVSMEPPTLLACVNKSASAHNVIDDSNRICVNILSVDDMNIVDCFSNSLKRSERFITGDWEKMKSGSPYIKTSLSAFDCKIVEKVTSGTHTIFIAEVQEVYSAPGSSKPLVYANREFCSLK